MALDHLQTVRLEVLARVAFVSLNRPEVRNAFHPTMIRELTEVFADLSTRTDLSAVVLQGAGKSFCSGADLGYMKEMAGFSLEENQQDANSLFAMFWALRSCPHPIVGRVHGHVMGGALGLAALCDIVAAVEGTQFCFSEVKLGLAPAVISPFVLERMNVAHARRFMLTGEVFDTTAARESGLVQFVGTEEAANVFVQDIVKTIRHSGAEATRATKALILATSDVDWKKAREQTTKVISERRTSVEGQEGLRGFLEKREPSWRYAEVKK